MLTVGYFFLFLIRYFALRKYFKNSQPPLESSITDLSVVIACKNEAHNIPSLLMAIENINYPKNKVEYIFIDDSSTDDTFKILSERINHDNCKLILANNKNYPGKKGAIDAGIKQANHNYIIITDADCLPDPEWLNAVNAAINDKYEIFFGIAPYIITASFRNNYFCFEQFINSSMYITAGKINSPYSAAARNFGFKKSAYYDLGKFDSTLQATGGDDDLLLQKAVKEGKNVGLIKYLPESYPYSHAPTTFANYFYQRARHVETSHSYDLKSKLVLAVFHILGFASLFSLVLIPFSLWYIFPFASRLLVDSLLVLIFGKIHGYTFKLLMVPLFSIMYEILIPINIINSFFLKRKWK